MTKTASAKVIPLKSFALGTFEAADASLVRKYLFIETVISSVLMQFQILVNTTEINILLSSQLEDRKSVDTIRVKLNNLKKAQLQLNSSCKFIKMFPYPNFGSKLSSELPEGKTS